MPACSNCVHRGDIIECSYARQDHPAVARSSRSPNDLPRNAQDKLDHLERLVVSLLDEKRASEQVATPSTTNGSSSLARHDRAPVIEADNERPSDEVCDRIDSTSISAASLCADNSELRWSVNEARWASLLNGVCILSLVSSFLAHHQY